MSGNSNIKIPKDIFWDICKVIGANDVTEINQDSVESFLRIEKFVLDKLGKMAERESYISNKYSKS